MAIIAKDNQNSDYTEARLIDQIIEFKRRCNLEDRIGQRYKLSSREVAGLFLLGTECMNSKDLSAGIGVSASRGSRIVQRLLVQGYLDSAQDRSDRRNQLLSLSAKGRTCLLELEKEKEACERQFLENLEGEQLETVRRGIDLLLRVF